METQLLLVMTTISCGDWRHSRMTPNWKVSTVTSFFHLNATDHNEQKRPQTVSNQSLTCELLMSANLTVNVVVWGGTLLPGSIWRRSDGTCWAPPPSVWALLMVTHCGSWSVQTFITSHYMSLPFLPDAACFIISISTSLWKKDLGVAASFSIFLLMEKNQNHRWKLQLSAVMMQICFCSLTSI